MNRIKEIAKRKKEELGENVTTKDLLFYIIDRLDDQQKRLSIVETKQKILYYMIPVMITIIGIVIGGK